MTQKGSADHSYEAVPSSFKFKNMHTKKNTWKSTGIASKAIPNLTNNKQNSVINTYTNKLSMEKIHHLTENLNKMQVFPEW